MKKYLKKYMGITFWMFFTISIIYLLISLFFANHYYFNTKINGVDVSLASQDHIHKRLKDYSEGYRLEIVGRNGDTQSIIGEEIEYSYNQKNSSYKIKYMQSPLKWVGSLFNKSDYILNDAFIYDEDQLLEKIQDFKSLNKEIIEPKDVSFFYYGGSYKIIKEEYGNKIDEDKLLRAIKSALTEGKKELNLEKANCYIDPKYTVNSSETKKAYDTLNKYIQSKITYIFGNTEELVDGNTIHKWLGTDENLNVVIDEDEVKKYFKHLSQKYNTAGKPREFHTSTDKVVIVEGGIYGWIINGVSETLALIKHIEQGDIITKEPDFTQRALQWGKNDLGDTYVEINITKQHMWFYKDGELLTGSPIVSGNPNRGNATVIGVYPLIYKQENATLRGEDYETPVSYWMPFFGNIGIHDAAWRSSFGGNIYLRNGSHGCINAPKGAAKIIYENIESGIPIVCYEEEQ